MDIITALRKSCGTERVVFNSLIFVISNIISLSECMKLQLFPNLFLGCISGLRLVLRDTVKNIHCSKIDSGAQAKVRTRAKVWERPPSH